VKMAFRVSSGALSVPCKELSSLSSQLEYWSNGMVASGNPPRRGGTERSGAGVKNIGLRGINILKINFFPIILLTIPLFQSNRRS